MVKICRAVYLILTLIILVGVPSSTVLGKPGLMEPVQSSIDYLPDTADWTVEGEEDGMQFGLPSLAGDVDGDGYDDLVIGFTPFGGGDVGKEGARLYRGSPYGLNIAPSWEIRNNQAMMHLGERAETAGDVNGDGYADVLVSAYGYDHGQTDEGRVFAFYGSPTGLKTSFDWAAESNNEGAQFGVSVSTAGDVNGDGFDDVMIGAPLYNNGQASEGALFVYYGSASGLGSSPAWVYQSNIENIALGTNVSNAGDVNGDGFSDVIAGAPHYSNEEYDEGRLYLFYGSAHGLSSTPDWTYESNNGETLLGANVSCVGDVNSDGYSDFAAGNDPAYSDQTYVFYGSHGGPGPSADWVSSGYGSIQNSAGDVNHDGYGELIAGNPWVDQVWLFYGSSSGLSTEYAWSAGPDETDAHFAWPLGTLGDVNGDGNSDLYVGAHAYRDRTGKTFVFYGRNGPIHAIDDLESRPGMTSDQVVLSWTVPGSAVNSYEIRYASEPITDDNWETANIVSNPPVPAGYGARQEVAVSNLAANTRWYFAVKYLDSAGTWSPLSNVPSLIDMGFRPKLDGYRFENYGTSYSDDYTYEDLVAMFGTDSTCVKTLEKECEEKPAAEHWRLQELKEMKKGHCAGMAATSMRFFEDWDDPLDFGGASTYAIELENNNPIRRHISYYFVEQQIDTISQARAQAKQSSVEQVIDQVLAYFSNPAEDALYLSISKNKSGHAISPYALQELGDGSWQLWVYDNNHPYPADDDGTEDASRYISLNSTDNTWEYQGFSPEWSGSGGEGTLGVIPVSLFQQQYLGKCPWCSDKDVDTKIYLSGDEQVLVTDPDGHRFGVSEGVFYDEIAGAFSTVPDAGAGDGIIYSLPAGSTYTLNLMGSQDDASLSIIGPGFVLDFGNLNLSPTLANRVILSGDGSGLEFQAGTPQTPGLTMITDEPGRGIAFTVRSAALAPGQTFALRNDPVQNQFSVENPGNSQSQFSFQMTLVNLQGDRDFVHNGIQLAGGDAGVFQYGAWNGQSLDLSIDHGMNGSLDESQVLENESNNRYFPLVH